LPPGHIRLPARLRSRVTHSPNQTITSQWRPTSRPSTSPTCSRSKSPAGTSHTPCRVSGRVFGQGGRGPGGPCGTSVTFPLGKSRARAMGRGARGSHARCVGERDKDSSDHTTRDERLL
jgi:hypothetical protein